MAGKHDMETGDTKKRKTNRVLQAFVGLLCDWLQIWLHLSLFVCQLVKHCFSSTRTCAKRVGGGVGNENLDRVPKHRRKRIYAPGPATPLPPHGLGTPLVFVLGWILCGYSMSIEHIYIRCQGAREI